MYYFPAIMQSISNFLQISVYAVVNTTMFIIIDIPELVLKKTIVQIGVVIKNKNNALSGFTL